MNALVKSEPKLMLLEYMADKYALRPEEFSKTVRATCGLSTATAEQVAAFLIVAKEYSLNPLTKEIYAFPGRGGGIVPIVSIDGWVNLVNSNPNCDGFEFTMDHSPDGKLISCNCTMYRKDRKHPVSVTEYLSECIRPTDPWKMQHRMLRHKALIQAARYAFGYAGIYDEDEGRSIVEADGGITTAPRDAGPPRVSTATKVIEHQPNPHDATAEQVQAEHETLVADEPEPPQVSTAPEPHELIPEPGKTNSFEGWATAYLALIETSPDKGTLLRWADVNLKRLETLKKSPEWTAKVTKATKAIYARLEKAAETASEPQGLPLDDMGGDAPPTDSKRPRGRPRGSGKAPDFAKDYDGWFRHQLTSIAAVETPEALEAIFELYDPIWSDIMPPDREALQGARREAERRLEQ